MADEEPMSSCDDSMYRLLVQSVTDYAIYLLDLAGNVSSWNPGAARAKGYRAEEIVGRHFSDFYTEEDRSKGMPWAALRRATEDGRFEGEGWRLRKDGTRFWAHVIIDPVRDDAGQMIGFAKITRDMTEQREQQRRAGEQERSFRLLVQGVTDYAIYMLNPDGTVSNWNAGAERAKGYRAEEIVGQHFSKFYRPEDQRKGLPQRALAAALAQGKFEGEGWRVRRDGSHFWAHVIIDTIYDEGRQLIGFAKITRDLSEVKRQNDQMARVKENLDLALANMSQGLCLYDAQERLVLRNDRFREICEFPPGTAEPGTTYTDLLWALHGSEAEEPQTTAARVAEQREVHLSRLARQPGYHLTHKTRQGLTISVHHRALPNGGWVSTLDDVTERHKIEERIVHLAHHDSLTSLANRNSFHAALESTLQEGKPCTLLYIDLDRFKPINDTLGHAVGDEVLQAVAGRIQAQLRGGDASARLGGDEFAALLVGCQSSDSAARTADRLIREIGRPIQAKGFEVTVGASVGIAVAPTHGHDASVLLRNADLALYSAKGGGRGRLCLYEAGMENSLLERRALECDLRQAILERQFSLHYQPVTNNRSHHITSVEALLRWQHPVRGHVSPAQFISLAEELGLMPEIGDWVLEAACQEAVNWPENISIAVNLSTTQFCVPDLVSRITRALEVTGLPASRLELEITETAMISDMIKTTEILNALRAIGVQVALDDFGTGYSSLSFLRTFPFTRIKIDRSFTQDLGTKPAATAIVRAVTGLCHGLGVATTAEGVETQEQLEILEAEGCREIQGYLISRPIPAADLVIWMEEYQALQPADPQLEFTTAA